MEATFISYIPLFQEPKPLQFQSASSYYVAKQTAIQRGNTISLAYGCLWTFNPTSVYFIIDQKQEVTEHLLEWAERDPEHWFTLDIVTSPTLEEGYFACIHPNLLSSYKRAMGTIDSRAQEHLDARDFLYCPIRFGGEENLPFDLDIKEITVGLVDIKNATDTGVSQIRESASILGTLDVRLNNNSTIGLVKGDKND
jgi:hypothetical protein